MSKLCKYWMITVLFWDNKHIWRKMRFPINREITIIVDDSSFTRGMVVLTTLIEEFCIILEREKSMSKSCWDVELELVLSTENNSIPFSIGWRWFPEIYCYIIDTSCSDTYEFCLCMFRLEMESTENSLCWLWMVILNELNSYSTITVLFFGIWFHEVSSFIREYSWFDDNETINRSGGKCSHYLIRLRRYLPYWLFIRGLASCQSCSLSIHLFW